ncbi:MAG: hypothetical protein AAF747_01355 [Planctomycetota bacterium]
MSAQPAQPDRQPPDQASRAFIVQRRERLRRVRKALAEQTAEVRTAYGALQHKLNACDALLVRRQEVAEAARAIEAERQRIHARIASGKASRGLAAVVVSSAIIAIGCWWAAAKVRPPTYVAGVELVATGELSDPKRWEDFHAELTRHPSVMERAAERLQRRGIISLGSPTQVREFLDSRLHAWVPSSGRLRMELSGEGQDATRRLLETIASAVLAEAEEAGPRRLDGSRTVMPGQVRVDEEPVIDERLIAAAVLFGVAAVVGGIGWWIVYIMASRAQQRLTQLDALATVVEDEGWDDPAPSVRRAA